MKISMRLVATAAVGTLVLAMAAVPAGSAEGDDATPEAVTTVESVIGDAAGGEGYVFIETEEGPIEVAFGPQPEVILPPEGGGPFTESAPGIVIEFEGDSEQITGPVEVSTEGTTGADGAVSSSASIANVNALIADIGSLDVECSADLAGGPTGSTTITDGEWIEGDLPENPEPSTTLEYSDEQPDGEGGTVSFAASLILNQQFVDADTITVVGAQARYLVELTPEEGETRVVQDITLTYGITSCGIDPVSEVPATPVRPAEAAQVTPRFTG